MGTSAVTRICKDNDYISFHTRWDGVFEIMSEHLVNLANDWQYSIDKLRLAIQTDYKGTTGLLSWLDDLEHVVDNHRKNPTLESTAMLYSGRSFNHHHILKPHEDHYGVDIPDLIATISNKTIVCEENSSDHEPLYSSKPVSSEYCIVSIHTTNSGILDFKLKGIDKDVFLKEIFLMPLFWRDLYSFIKIINHRPSKKENNLISDCIYKLARKLNMFYIPSKDYSAYGRYQDQELTPERLKEYKDDLFEELIALIPFDMYSSAFATHLMLRFPGKVELLTTAEMNAEYSPSFMIDLVDKRLTTIGTYMSPELQKEIEEEWLKRELEYTQYNKCSAATGFSLNYDNGYVMMPYEESIVKVFESQRELELK